MNTTAVDTPTILSCLRDTQEAEDYATLLVAKYGVVRTCKRDDLVASLQKFKTSLLLIELDWLPTNPRDPHPLKSLVYPNATPDMPALLAIADRQGSLLQFDPLDSHFSPFDAGLTRPVDHGQLLRLLQNISPPDTR